MFNLLLYLLLLLAPAPALAQNPTCPTRPAGDNSNACASTAFVQQNSGGTPSLIIRTTAQLQALNLAPIAVGQSVIKTGYTVDGDMPVTDYYLMSGACDINAGAGDGGAEIASNTSGRCWHIVSAPSLDPRAWGATPGTSDSRAAINAALLYANTIGQMTFVDLGGNPYQVSDSIGCPTVACSYIGIRNGYLQPTSGWTGGADPIVSFPSVSGAYGAGITVESINIDATSAHTANGIYVQAKTSYVRYNHVVHTPSYGIKIDDTGTTANGTQVNGNTTWEWQGSDPQFTTQSNFTSAGIWIIGADAQVNFNLPYYSKYPILLGDASGDSAGNGRFIGNHPFNGCGGVGGCTRTNPYDVYIFAGTGNDFDGLYLDDGVFAMQSDSNIVANVTFAGPVTGVCLSQRFLDLSSSTNDIPALHLSGPMTGGVVQPAGCSGAGSAVPILFMGTGTGNWDASVNQTALNAWTGAGRIDKAQSFIAVSQGVSNAATFLGNNASSNGIIVLGPSSTNGASFATNGTNAAMVDDSGNSAIRVDDYGPILHGAQITTVSGCGTSPTISGSNGLGHVVFGTSPSTTCTITFAGANWPSATGVNCDVSEPSSPTDVQAWATTTSTLTVTLAAPVATHKLQWHCWLEQ